MHLQWGSRLQLLLLEPGVVPRLAVGQLHLSTCCCLFRDKSKIYHASQRPTPVLISPQLNTETGSRKRPVVVPSELFSKSVRKAMETLYHSELDHIKEYFDAGRKLGRHLYGRKIPLEGVHLRRRQEMVAVALREKFGSETDLDVYGNLPEVKADYEKTRKRLENSILYKWAPVEFDQTAALSYLMARSSGEYAVLVDIFREIRNQEASWQPRTLFDFGSGIATGYWAATEVFGKFSEVFCVDSSPSMNALAKNIINQGEENKPLPTGISFRFQSPSSTSLKYDLVLSAYSMMELASSEQRLEVMNKLWSRVELGGCLVLVELGTNAGFQIISEARDFLRQLTTSEDPEAGPGGDILAPCPHAAPCPRYFTDTIPCNFPARYRFFDLAFFQKFEIQRETYSYLVMKKGKRERDTLPRLVEEPLHSKNVFYCRLCTLKGTLQEVLCNKKDRPLFELTKRLHCGQELPVRLDYSKFEHRGDKAAHPDEDTTHGSETNNSDKAAHPDEDTTDGLKTIHFKQ